MALKIPMPSLSLFTVMLLLWQTEQYPSVTFISVRGDFPWIMCSVITVAENWVEPLMWQSSHFLGYDLKIGSWPPAGWSLSFA